MKRKTGHSKSVILRAVTLCMLISSALLFQSFSPKKNELTACYNRSFVYEHQAQEQVIEMLINRTIGSEAWLSFYKVPSHKRAGLARELFLEMKSFTGTEEFRNLYQHIREKNKPQHSVKNVPAEQREILQYNYEQASKLLESMQRSATREEQPKIEKQITLIRQELDKLADPESVLSRWNKEFPASPEALIKVFLQRFLSETEEINFQACVRFNKQTGMPRFMNPKYESKPAAWKACFHAGPQATLTIRELAIQWMNELDSYDTR